MTDDDRHYTKKRKTKEYEIKDEQGGKYEKRIDVNKCGRGKNFKLSLDFMGGQPPS